MTGRTRVTRALLWLFVILLGIEIGAGLYEARVIVPLWADSPPESAWLWEAHREANPRLAPDAGRGFWMFATPSLGLAALVTLMAGRKARGEQRRWRAYRRR
jgi:H+/Cl- antiporter ClcA